jgi:hypothetical protein
MEKFVRLNQYQRRIGYLLLMVAREVNGDARVTDELQLVKVNEVGLLKVNEVLKVKGLGLNNRLCIFAPLYPLLKKVEQKLKNMFLLHFS